MSHTYFSNTSLSFTTNIQIKAKQVNRKNLIIKMRLIAYNSQREVPEAYVPLHKCNVYETIFVPVSRATFRIDNLWPICLLLQLAQHLRQAGAELAITQISHRL